MNIEAVALENRWVRLEPFTAALRDEVRTAVDVDEPSWHIMVQSAFGPAFEGWWNGHLADTEAGRAVVYAVRRPDGRIVGASGLFDIHPVHRRLELGGTFYHPDARGGPVNPACKRLLLEHAFSCGALRVEIITDAINARSRAAIAKMGAVEEGVLRRHKVTHTGRVRDTAMSAVTDLDWPDVRGRLDARLAAFE